MKKSFSVMLLLCVIQLAAGQYRADLIPSDISRGSDAVIRDYEYFFDYKSPSSAVDKTKVIITVLNSEGESHGHFHWLTRTGRGIKNFSGEVFDAQGKSIRKIKKGDLKFFGYSHGLADDTKTYYYDLRVAQYPYTVVYNYEIEYKNGIFTFPVFSPSPGTRVGVEKATYTARLPENVPYRVKQVNIEKQPQEVIERGLKQLRWNVEKLAPVPDEPFSPSPYEITPMVVIAPDEFVYEGYAGKMTDWKEYGKWQWGLLEGRDELPDELKGRIRQLTADASSDKEKVKILYDFLGEQTRYVSIQLGIGGWQPMKAADVYRNKFGDCKALTNFLMAMLKECGIESYYTEIGMGKKRIWEDFPNQFQTNHVVLCVPVDGEEIWLECTNPDLPFGYVHRDIAGNDALVCRDGTMFFTTLPVLEDSLNFISKKLDITISPDRTARMQFSSSYTGHAYEQMWGYDKLSSPEQLNKASSLVNVAQSRISGIDYSEEKTSLPVFRLSFDVEATGFGDAAGSRILLPVNPLHRKLMTLPRSRSLDIEIKSGSLRADTIVYRIPEGYFVESAPHPFETVSDFGTYKLEVMTGENSVTIVNSLLIKSGRRDAAEYDELKKFFKTIEDTQRSMLAIKPSDS